MATLTFENKEQNRLIKRFHTLVGRTGIGSAGKEGLLAGYGVESSKDLSVSELIECCNYLDMQLNPKLAELDKARKRLMASIGAWLRAMHVNHDASYIKAVACRAAKRDNFNEIPFEQLRSLYASFNKMKQDLSSVESLTVDMINHLSLNN